MVNWNHLWQAVERAKTTKERALQAECTYGCLVDERTRLMQVGVPLAHPAIRYS